MTINESVRPRRTNTILYCDRWRETVRFYRDLLNLPVLMDNGWFVEFRLTENACLSVADAAHASIASARGAGMTLSLRVEDIDILHDRMASVGIDATPIRKIWGVRGFFVYDPEGHRIELWS